MKRIRFLDLLLTLALLLTAVAVVSSANSSADNSIRVASARTSSPTLSGGNWTLECVDCPRWFRDLTEHSLQLDSSGFPHVAYGGDHLYYARHDGEGWVYETVDDAAGVGSHASLALDAAGRPHISYHDDVTGLLKRAWHDGSVWHVEPVDQVGSWYGHGHASLALGASGQPHISYYDYLSSELKYARHDGTQWSIETLTASSEEVSEYSSLVIDASDRPHIVYFDAQLTYAWHDGENWQTEPVDSDANLLGYPSLRLDASGQPSVSYFDGYPGYELKYAWRDGVGWHIDTVDEEGGWYGSLALDNSDHPRISYLVGGDLKYATRGAGNWQIETVTAGDIATTGWGTALALHPGTGQPHILYRASNGDLQLVYLTTPASGDSRPTAATLRSGVAAVPASASLGHAAAWQVGTHTEAGASDAQAWLSETVDRSAETGWFSAIAVDGGGGLHISYYGDGLKYARTEGTAWQISTVDKGVYTGAFSSIALDSAGFAHVAYQDWEGGNLKYARHTGTIWLAETVDRAGYVGEYSSLALDSTDRPHISYFDRTNSDLKYAWRDGLNWQIVMVPITDSTHVGMYASLALDRSDRPHISFQADGALMYATLAVSATELAKTGPVRTVDGLGMAWQTETVPVTGTVQAGLYSSLRLDAADQPRISFFDGTNGRLGFAWRDGGTWHVEAVPTDTVGRAGLYSSLALDDGGQPHIAFYNETDGDLKYAAWNGAGWQVETVAEIGDVGRYAALALDGKGERYITFFDASNRDLRLARLQPSAVTSTRREIFLPVTLRSAR